MAASCSFFINVCRYSTQTLYVWEDRNPTPAGGTVRITSPPRAGSRDTWQRSKACGDPLVPDDQPSQGKPRTANGPRAPALSQRAPAQATARRARGRAPSPPPPRSRARAAERRRRMRGAGLLAAARRASVGLKEKEGRVGPRVGACFRRRHVPACSPAGRGRAIGKGEAAAAAATRLSSPIGAGRPLGWRRPREKREPAAGGGGWPAGPRGGARFQARRGRWTGAAAGCLPRGPGACWTCLTGCRVALLASSEKGSSSNCLALTAGYWEASQMEIAFMSCSWM